MNKELGGWKTLEWGEGGFTGVHTVYSHKDLLKHFAKKQCLSMYGPKCVCHNHDNIHC